MYYFNSPYLKVKRLPILEELNKDRQNAERNLKLNTLINDFKNVIQMNDLQIPFDETTQEVELFSWWNESLNFSSYFDKNPYEW